ncbi:LysR family transcriptional regulator [Dechloromonas sp. XY25]|uniref:LysR family transcriptional regulator n=1 Tax=Dechloromonas hankyongensis TaxID=2908002 RepID=A0ABS9K1C0_9RHOO|nr:LysR family transcriptional regulator [Dechloromonas hankyongensis]MCG2576967.1 LysR family transcriptional regulator [Dechloromonas hankyongensis]
MSLDANDLILFAHIMEAGSFSKAAERTGLPKSTLSRRITALETKLGERLLTRSTRRLAITEFGERILDHAKRLLEETEAASAMALHRQGTPRGVLRVSMPPDFRELDLTPLLLQFAASYPEVRLELDLSPRRVDLLAERFDLAVRAASRLPDDGTLVARKLCDMLNGLYASTAYLKRYGIPASPPELLDHVGLRLIGGNGEALPWRLSRGTETWEGLPNGPLAANSPSLQRDLAAHGMGIVALDERFAEKMMEQGLLQRVLPDWSLPTVTLWCVTPGRRLIPTRTTAFIELLRNALTRGR